MAEQHVNYFALEKACKNPGCPLCSIIYDRIDRYIDGMLFEHISDRGFRAQYREAGGFCNEHSEILLSYRDGLAVAILGHESLSYYIDDFKKKKIRKYKEPCPACAEKSRIEKEFLTFLAEVTNEKVDSDKKLIEFFTKSDGLCVPHYSLLIQYAKKIPKWLANFQESKFNRLLERTSRFIDFSAWGKQQDFAKLSVEDKVVWKELAQALRGVHKKELEI